MRKREMEVEIKRLTRYVSALRDDVDLLRCLTGVGRSIDPHGKEAKLEYQEFEQGILPASLVERIRRLERAHVWVPAKPAEPVEVKPARWKH